MRQIFTLLLLLLFLNTTYSQVNGYAKVTSINGNTLSLSDADEMYGAFTAGQKVIIMQMQDNVIGNNTTDNASFGNLGSIQSAGLYEILQINSVNRAGNTLNSIRLTTVPGNNYHITANSSVQVVTFPVLGNPNYTTLASMTSPPWNGNTGGVLAFSVNGTLTLNHNINADGKGFRGGITNGGGSADCGDATRYRTSEQENYGNKGEGIYKTISNNHAAGRGKILNGGGGGNSHNAGGGGGGNYTGGGQGGPGWVCDPGMGGLGGLALRSNITSNRIFMGGGGGAGEANDNNATEGGDGGGIIFIQATTVRTTGTGDTIRISSNGTKGANGTNDGVGGGGAGGSVLFMVNNWNAGASKPILVMANGANGSDVVHADQHGGGGGGGQGVIINILSAFASNVAATTTNGRGGLNNTNGTRAESGTGNDNAGVIGMTVLPVKLIYFTGNLKDGRVLLSWQAADGLNSGYFIVQRTADGIHFNDIGTVSIQPNRNAVYSFTDLQPLQGISYYRLKVMENISSISYSKVVLVRTDRQMHTGISVAPNPAANSAWLNINTNERGIAFVQILSADGAVQAAREYAVSAGVTTIALQEINKLTNGTYMVRTIINGSHYTARLVVQK